MGTLVHPREPHHAPNADTHYTGFKDTNHGSWDQAYATDDLPDWFMMHTK